MKLFNFLPLILSALIISGCGQAPETEYYYDYDPYENLGARAWSSSQLPLIIEVPDQLSANFEDQIIQAGERWNQALGRTVFIFNFNQVPNTQWNNATDSLKDNFFGLFRQVSWNFPDIGSGVLAYTSTLSRSSNILHSDIIFNFANYNFADHDSPPSELGTNYIDFESVLVHELGHFLGLGHTSLNEDPSSVMLPTLRKGEARRDLSDGDIERIRQLYLRL